MPEAELQYESVAEPLAENDEIFGGRTYIMYHGTSWNVAQLIRDNGFNPSVDGMLGSGVYLSRDEKFCLFLL